MYRRLSRCGVRSRRRCRVTSPHLFPGSRLTAFRESQAENSAPHVVAKRVATSTDPVTGIEESKAAALPEAKAPNGFRILLAEDDPMVARSTATVLRRLGHTVVHSTDGTAAWERLLGHFDEFDALLIDLVMPRMSGADLAHRVRAAGFAGRIVLFSGLVMQVDPEALALLGIQHFITKPFLPAELERAFRSEGPA